MKKFLGVYFDAHNQQWRARVEFDHKMYYLGFFDTAEAAARERDAFVKRKYGDKAILNFPEHA